MKKLLLLICILFGVSGFSQSFNLSELIKLCRSNDEFFDTYVSQKGYQFSDITDEDHLKGESYTFKIKGANTYYISKYVSDYNGVIPTNYYVSFQTPSSKNYLGIKSEIINNGYKFKKKEILNGDQVFEYIKANILVRLVSFVEDGKERINPRTGYLISISIDK